MARTLGGKDAWLFFHTLPLFQGLSEGQVEALAARATARVYQPGELILNQDEQATGFFVLASGRAKLFKLLPDGHEQTIYIFSPGEPFCLCSAFEEQRHPATAAALEESVVYVISGQDFQQAARETPELLLNILMVLSRRLKEAMDRIESLSTRDLGQRLALFLVRFAAEGGREDGLNLAMTHRELAKIIGVTPEALSRTFRKLTEAGLVQVDGQAITFTDAARLRELATSGDI